MSPILLAVILMHPGAQAPTPPQGAEPVGIARIRRDAEALIPQVTTDLAREFLGSASSLPAVAPRTLYFDPAKKLYLGEAAAARLDPTARAELKPFPADETFYYNTKYGSPLAYARPLELLGLAGLAQMKGRKVLDFGYGGVGPLRLIATAGADVTGVDVDPLLPVLYAAPSDQGVVAGRHGRDGRITLVDGRYPADGLIKAKVGDGYDVILAKNTLKRGYVHPDGPADKRRLIDLGVDDATFVASLYAALKPGGWALIYNLAPAPSPPDKPFNPSADGRCPFARGVWEAAGFRVEAHDKDDSPAARAMAHALGWDAGAGAMVLEKDLFATYTLVRKPVAAAADLDRIREAVRGDLARLHRDASFPGTTAGFVLPDGRAASVAVGMADVDRNVPMTASGRMLAGSIGKTYVSAVALQLVAEGKLALDDKVDRWLGEEPWFPRLPNAHGLTLRMLMNHTSGIPEHVLDKAFIAALREQPDRTWSPPELVAYVLGKKPLFAAGQGWSYADTNYILVGMIVEKATGRALYDEVDRRLLGPLHLKDTSPSVSRTIPGLVPGHSHKGGPFDIEGPTLIDGKSIYNPQFEWAGGGFVATAQDLARWGHLLYGGEVLKPESLDALRAGVPAKTGRGDRYGLGVQIRQSPWGDTYGHGGWFPGYLSEMEYFAGPKLAVAVQFNTDDVRSLGRGPRSYVAEVARAILAVDQPAAIDQAGRVDRPRIFAPEVIPTEDNGEAARIGTAARGDAHMPGVLNCR